VPGMAHFPRTGPAGKPCGECAFLTYEKPSGKRSKGCRKFFESTGRHGPEVPGHTPSCRHFHQKETDQMVSMRERYPKQGIFSAEDFTDIGDEGITLTIARLELDVGIGNSTRDVVYFEDDGRGLSLNMTNAHTIEKLYGDSKDWPGKKLNLYLDHTVTFNNQPKPGVRVRAPKEDGNGPTPRLPAAIVPKRPSLKEDLDDSLDDFR
jgi:hypothetical protein